MLVFKRCNNTVDYPIMAKNETENGICFQAPPALKRYTDATWKAVQLVVDCNTVQELIRFHSQKHIVAADMIVCFTAKHDRESEEG